MDRLWRCHANFGFSLSDFQMFESTGFWLFGLQNFFLLTILFAFENQNIASHSRSVLTKPVFRERHIFSDSKSLASARNAHFL